METVVRSLGLAALLACSGLLVACGGSASTDQNTSSNRSNAEGDAANECVDEDGDGFGEGCESGADCDDRDDTAFEGCGVCLDTAEGCACEPGTAPVKCTVEGAQDTNLCDTGLRSCRDGEWTACEGIAQFE